MRGRAEVVWWWQRATFQALRCFYAARSYLAAGKPLEALGLFQRTAERAGQAEAAWDDLERPSLDALAELDSLKAQCQVAPPPTPCCIPLFACHSVPTLTIV